MDGLTREYDETPFYWIDTMSAEGRGIAARYGVRRVPELILFDNQGDILLRQSGRIDRDAVDAAMANLR